MNVVQGLIEEGVRKTSGWNDYTFGDGCRLVLGSGTLSEQRSRVLACPDLLHLMPSIDSWVVIVGAGPVGLWTAIQLRLLAPHVAFL